MFGLIKRIFIGLLIGLVNRSNNAKCVSFRNQKIIQPTLINLHPEYSYKFNYYPFAFAVKLDFLAVVILLMT